MEERREAERLARSGPAQSAMVQPAAEDVATAWATAFPWAGPTPMLIGLTGLDDDEDA